MWGLRLVSVPIETERLLSRERGEKTIAFSVQHTPKTTASSVAVCVDTCDLFYM